MVNNVQSGRDTFFDSCKYLLILLVIAGHIMESYKHLYGWMTNLYSFIYLFHMPFFAFISGYFSKRVTVRKEMKGTLLLLESFLILQTGFLLFYNKDWPEWRAVLSPWYAPWYLLSLVWWRWIAVICLRMNKPWLGMSLAVIIGIGSGLLSGHFKPTSFLSMARTCIFLPFFMAGLYMSHLQIQMIRRLNHLPFLALAGIIALSITLFRPEDLNPVEYGNGFKWGEVSLTTSLQLLGMRLYFFSSAALLIVSFLNLWPDLKRCAGFGAKTMFFFSYHIFFVLLFNYYLRRWLHIYHPGWWYPLTGFTLTVLCLNVLSRFPVFSKLLNPVSSGILFFKSGSKK